MRTTARPAYSSARTHAYKGRARYNWKILLSGYLDEYVYELEMIDTTMPLAKLKKLSLVNARAERADTAKDFSLLIREGLPRPTPYTLEQFEAPQ